MTDLEGIQRELRYPLQPASLFVIVGLSIVIYFGVVLTALSLVLAGGAPVYWLGAFGWLILLKTFVEYGADIIEASAKGLDEPPAMAVAAHLVSLSDRRFLLFMLGILVLMGGAYELHDAGLVALSWAVVVFGISSVPATLAMLALSDDPLHIFNPVQIVRCIGMLGYVYLVALAIPALIVGLIYLLASGRSTWLFLTILLSMYLLVLFFRVLGRRMYVRRELFGQSVVSAPELDAARRSQAQDRAIDAAMHEAYQLGTVNRVDSALLVLLPLVRGEPQARFDRVFTEVAAWRNKRVAMRLLKNCMPDLITEQRWMQALSLCRWCLDQDEKFSLSSGFEIQTLAKKAVSREQCDTAVRLIENFTTANPADPFSAGLRTLATSKQQDVAFALCRTQLQDPDRADRLAK